MHSRRSFMTGVLAATVGVATLRTKAHAADGPVTEQDPAAHSQGFRADTTQVDETRYPAHSADQSCGACEMYCGRGDEPLGTCAFYDGRPVPSTGWCRNFAYRTQSG
jgi:hypothetical protein